MRSEVHGWPVQHMTSHKLSSGNEVCSIAHTVCIPYNPHHTLFLLHPYLIPLSLMPPYLPFPWLTFSLHKFFCCPPPPSNIFHSPPTLSSLLYLILSVLLLVSIHSFLLKCPSPPPTNYFTLQFEFFSMHYPAFLVFSSPPSHF